jgi:hypothetical protein
MTNTDFVNAWNRTPMMTKLSIMARMVVQKEDPQISVMKLIELVGLMASMLNGEARVAIADQLRDEADALAPLPNRRIH